MQQSQPPRQLRIVVVAVDKMQVTITAAAAAAAVSTVIVVAFAAAADSDNVALLTGADVVVADHCICYVAEIIVAALLQTAIVVDADLIAVNADVVDSQQQRHRLKIGEANQRRNSAVGNVVLLKLMLLRHLLLLLLIEHR